MTQTGFGDEEQLEETKQSTINRLHFQARRSFKGKARSGEEQKEGAGIFRHDSEGIWR